MRRLKFAFPTVKENNPSTEISGDVFRYMEIFSHICHAPFLLSQFFFVGSTQILMEQKRKTVRVTPWHNISSQEVFPALCTAIAYFCLPDEALPTRWCSEIHSFGDRQKIFSRLWIPWTHPRLEHPVYHIWTGLWVSLLPAWRWGSAFVCLALIYLASQCELGFNRETKEMFETQGRCLVTRCKQNK